MLISNLSYRGQLTPNSEMKNDGWLSIIRLTFHLYFAGNEIVHLAGGGRVVQKSHPIMAQIVHDN